jgi:hypothetical protein
MLTRFHRQLFKTGLRIFSLYAQSSASMVAAQ